MHSYRVVPAGYKLVWNPPSYDYIYHNELPSVLHHSPSLTLGTKRPALLASVTYLRQISLTSSPRSWPKQIKALNTSGQSQEHMLCPTSSREICSSLPPASGRLWPRTESCHLPFSKTHGPAKKLLLPPNFVPLRACKVVVPLPNSQAIQKRFQKSNEQRKSSCQSLQFH